MSQNAQRLQLLRPNFVGHGIENAQRTHAQTFGRDERHPRVKTQARFAGDERVVAESLVVLWIGNDQQIAARNGVRAKRNIAANFAQFQTVIRFVPLPVFVDESQRCH